MNEENNICREGIIREVSEGKVLVEIIVSSACSGCHAKSICIPSDRREERIWVATAEGENYAVGEVVELSLKASAGNKAVALAYVAPLVVLLAVLFGTYALTSNELLSVSLSVLCVIAYYLVLKTMNRRIEDEITFSVQKKQS